MKWNEEKLAKRMFTDEKLIWGLEAQVEDPDLGNRWFKKVVYFTDSRMLWNIDTIKPEAIPYESIRTIGKEGSGSGGFAGVQTTMKGGGVINVGSTYGDLSFQCPDAEFLKYALWLLNEVQNGKPLSPAEGVPAVQGQLDRNAPPPTPTKKGGCFVATAACGTASFEVQYLCQFRDEVLTKTGFGRAFIGAYYSVSPVLSGVIERSAILRFIVRKTFIEPLVHVLKRIKAIR